MCVVCLSMYIKTKSSTKLEENSVSRRSPFFSPFRPGVRSTVTFAAAVGDTQLGCGLSVVTWDEVGFMKRSLHGIQRLT